MKHAGNPISISTVRRCIANAPVVAFFLVLGLAIASPARAAQSDSLVARFYATGSIRNPAYDQHPEVKTITTGGVSRDTTVMVDNWFDYDINFGLTGQYGKIAFAMDYVFKKVSTPVNDDNKFINQSYDLTYRTPAYAIGGRAREIGEANDLYDFSVFAEGTVMKWVGVGVTRQHRKHWIGEAQNLARFSLAKNQFTYKKLALNVNAVYEVNPNRQNVFFRTEITNLRSGRYALVPFYQLIMVKQGKTTQRAYQGTVRLEIGI